MFGRTKKTYRVRPIGRSGLIYEEDGKRVLIDSEILVPGEFDIVIYLERVEKWDPPHDSLPITAEDRSRIRRNLEDSYRRSRIDWA